MKLAPFFGLFGLFLLPWSALGQDTAYQALRTFGAERGPEVLKSVIEVKGRAGAPQPETWTIVLNDPRARGGVREVGISQGKIVSERTPVNAYSGVAIAMDFQKLNLDSQGAFTLAEEQARQAKVSFDSVDYTLRQSESANTPVWVLDLLDPVHRFVGTVRIAADTGKVASQDFRAVSERDGGEAGARETDRHAEQGKPHRHDNLAHRIDRGLHRIGGTLQEFFTGRRTVDRRFDGE